MMKIKRMIYVNDAMEKARVQAFFNQLRTIINLGGIQNAEMINDYVHAFAYFQKKKMSLDEILDRLDLSRLGNVYTEDDPKWYQLDTAAMVYPLGMGHGSMGMFRLSYYLNKHVSPEILQVALNNIIQRFPTFASTLRRGFFWHYLDTSKMHYKIHLDNAVPCNVINISYAKSQVFKVYYYENRISIDFFHVVTDGAGGQLFLNTLLGEYLYLMGEKVIYDEQVLNIFDEPKLEEENEAFNLIPDIENDSSFADKMPLQTRGRRSRTKKRVLHFTMPTQQLINLAHKKNITLTELLLGFMFISFKKTSSKEKGSFSIQVPFNMRKYYPSLTLRNFSLYAIIKAEFNQIDDCPSFYELIQNQLKEKTSKEVLDKMGTMSKNLVRKLNYVPLFIKIQIMRIIYPILSERVISSTLSNLGPIKVNESLGRKIDKADFVLSVQQINRSVCSLVSINDKSVFSISKITKDKSFEDTMYQLFIDNGIDVDVTGGENFGI